jgi:predicted nucleotidyltransferase
MPRPAAAPPASSAPDARFKTDDPLVASPGCTQDGRMETRRLQQAAVSERERDALKAAATMLKRRFPVAEVVLFGSRARGEGDPESDLDLLVLTTRSLDWRERAAIVDALFDIELSHDVVLSPLVVPQAEWRRGAYAGLPIHDEIGRDGVAV